MRLRVGLYVIFIKMSSVDLGIHHYEMRINNAIVYNVQSYFLFISITFAMPGADPGFLETGFLCIMVWAVRFADLISFFLNIP